MINGWIWRMVDGWWIDRKCLMLDQGVSASVLLTSGAGSPSDVGRPGHYRVLNTVSGLRPPHTGKIFPSAALTTKNMSRFFQVSPGGLIARS